MRIRHRGGEDSNLIFRRKVVLHSGVRLGRVGCSQQGICRGLATVDMAICDLHRDGKRISVASIKDLIHSNKEWRDKLKKAYFKDADIQRAIKKCQDLFES